MVETKSGSKALWQLKHPFASKVHCIDLNSNETVWFTGLFCSPQMATVNCWFERISRAPSPRVFDCKWHQMLRANRFRPTGLCRETQICLIAIVHFKIAILLTERAVHSGIMIMLLERLYLRKLFDSSLQKKQSPACHTLRHPLCQHSAHEQIEIIQYLTSDKPQPTL